MTTQPDSRLPILVGVGQTVQRDLDAAATLHSPLDLMAMAARHALADSGAGAALATAIDVLAVVRMFEHSVGDRGMWANPFGSSNNVPWSLAKRLALRPDRAIYAEVGGQSPQRLINTLAASLHAGEIRAALLTGAEAIATIRHATRQGITLDWHEDAEGEFEDRWPGKPFVTPYEQRHGIAWPIHVYALFEQVRREAMGFDLARYRAEIGRLFAPFSAVAAANPFAQFPVAHTPEFLASVSRENYLLCEPYTRWMVAQDAVNQSAAVIVTTVGTARALGIAESRWVYLHGQADVDELTVLRRPRLDRSEAQNLAVSAALGAAACTLDDIRHLDCYSCFPIAVTSIAEPLGLPLDGSRPLTLTGGLPFFGGPGNNYSMHAIATLVERLRNDASAKGLIVANGGYLSKHSAGVYAAHAPRGWSTTDTQRLAAELAGKGEVSVNEEATGPATIESCAAIWQKGVPADGFVVARMRENGARCLARVTPGDEAGLAALFENRVAGRPISITRDTGTHRFTLAAG